MGYFLDSVLNWKIRWGKISVPNFGHNPEVFLRVIEKNCRMHHGVQRFDSRISEDETGTSLIWKG